MKKLTEMCQGIKEFREGNQRYLYNLQDCVAGAVASLNVVFALEMFLEGKYVSSVACTMASTGLFLIKSREKRTNYNTPQLNQGENN